MLLCWDYKSYESLYLAPMDFIFTCPSIERTSCLYQGLSSFVKQFLTNSLTNNCFCAEQSYEQYDATQMHNKAPKVEEFMPDDANGKLMVSFPASFRRGQCKKGNIYFKNEQNPCIHYNLLKWHLHPWCRFIFITVSLYTLFPGLGRQKRKHW